jgi:hypothetical protein
MKAAEEWNQPVIQDEKNDCSSYRKSCFMEHSGNRNLEFLITEALIKLQEERSVQNTALTKCGGRRRASGARESSDDNISYGVSAPRWSFQRGPMH